MPNDNLAPAPPVADLVRQQLTRLSELSPPELKEFWRRHYQVPVPRGMSRDLLTRFIAYRIQEDSLGSSSKSPLRRLETMERSMGQSGTDSRPNIPSLKPGTNLGREWHGTTHTVTILEDGFEYRGQIYASLTKVAAAISGLHRSGPAFFGLKGRLPRFVPRSGAVGDDHEESTHD